MRTSRHFMSGTLPAAIRLAIVVLGVASWVGGTVSAQASPTAPGSIMASLEQHWYMVVDRAGMLDEGQERSAIDDAYRLFLIGIPTQIVTEATGFTQDQAEYRAHELRIANGIESATGRDDGILVYLSADPDDRASVTIVISVGSGTLPNGGLTRGDMDTIRETIVAPQLDDGRPARAIVYSLREMLYQQQFTPPPPAARSGRLQDVRTPFQIAAPVITAGIAIWLVTSRRSGRWSPIIMSLLAAAIMLGLSVVTESGLGVACALALVALAAGIAIARDSAIRSSPLRQVIVSPRPPGSFRASNQ